MRYTVRTVRADDDGSIEIPDGAIVLDSAIEYDEVPNKDRKHWWESLNVFKRVRVILYLLPSARIH